MDGDRKLYTYNDDVDGDMAVTASGEQDQLVEFFEVYEKIKISYINLFYRIPPDPEQLKAIKQQADVQMKEMQAEMEVQLLEQQRQMQEAVQTGDMLQKDMNLK